MAEFLLWTVIAVALVFDFVNGFHDAANSIATVVATRVLPPFVAVCWAAAFNFIAFLVFGTHVAATIANNVVEQSVLIVVQTRENHEAIVDRIAKIRHGDHEPLNQGFGGGMGGFGGGAFSVEETK